MTQEAATLAALERQIVRLETILEAYQALSDYAKTLPVGRANSRQRWRWAAFDEAARVVSGLRDHPAPAPVPVAAGGPQ